MTTKHDVVVDAGARILVDGTKKGVLIGAKQVAGLLLIRVLYEDRGKVRRGCFVPRRVTVISTKPVSPPEVKDAPA